MKVLSFFFKSLVLVFVSFFCLSSVFSDDQQTESSAIRVYPKRFDPADRPDVERYWVQPPTWATFNGSTQFIALRSFPSKDDVGTDFAETIDRYQNEELGRIVWPHASTIFYKNLGELADEIKKRDLFLFDFWGYVPGSGPRESGDWTQFIADPAQFRLLEEKLGAQWLGMDNGEQDGRYVGGYAPFSNTGSGDRFEQYLNFQRHFEKMGDDLGNRLATLVSLNFGHYFLKEGVYTLIGAETAQALPNSQIYYSWIRGAGKQYGVLWFGNASIYNRWGWKSYPDKPTKGSSLALLKRLMYSHILYNSAAVGYEAGWFVGEELGPIGKIQQSAKRWLDENGDPGVMVAPVAFLCDFNCGWSFPRHLYTGKSYLVWGNIPYSAGDYLTNDLFDLAYPGYQDSSYFRNEKGFLTPTPFGDSVDALLSDAPEELLEQYATVFIADELTPSVELYDKLNTYVKNGGRLVATADALKKLGRFADVELASDELIHFEADADSEWIDGTKVTESRPFDVYRLSLPENAKTIAQCDENPLVVEVSWGKGSFVAIASPFGLSSQRAFGQKVENAEEKSLPNPYPLLEFARKTFETELERDVLFHVGDGLSSVVCRKDANVYTIGIFNNELCEKPFEITSRIGKITSVRELVIDESERSAVGFLPENFENAELGINSESTIAGGSVRIFEVTLEEENVVALEPTTWSERPKDRFLALHGFAQIQTPLKESILTRPTFFQHWDGVSIDWKYLASRSEEQLAKEAGWLQRQKVRIVVDCTSGINLYPDLRLIDNDRAEWDRSMDVLKSIISKAAILHAEALIVRTHRMPENNFNAEKTWKGAVESIRQICALGAQNGLKICLRIAQSQGSGWNVPGGTNNSALSFLDEVQADNLFVAPTLFSANDAIFEPELWKRLKPRILFVMGSGWQFDENNGSVWSESLPISVLSNDNWNDLQPLTALDIPVVFDSVYRNADEEYIDVKCWNEHVSVEPQE